MKLYFLDDGSLIIAEPSVDKPDVISFTLLPPEKFEVIKGIDYYQLRYLCGNTAYNLLAEQSLSQDKDKCIKVEGIEDPNLRKIYPDEDHE